MKTIQSTLAAAAYLVICAILLVACAPQVRETVPPAVAVQVPEDFPLSDYEHAKSRGKPVDKIDAGKSLVVITVRRGGPLAHFGHDHAVASHDVTGYVLPEEGRADLYVPLEKLVVDESALRIEAGLDTQPSESDIAGTRSNMLNKVLQTQQYQYALIHVSSGENTPMGTRLTVAITLHGVTRTFETLSKLVTEGNEMIISGALEFNQSDFGIVPFSVFGGALQVLDHLNLRFSIVADRIRP